MTISAQEMQSLYRQTVIVRRPTYGIISGYHELPYVCIGQGFEEGAKTSRIKGKIQVSPRFVIRPTDLGPSYAEIFGDEHVDGNLTGRIFGYMGFRNRPVECTSEYLEVEQLSMSVDHALNESMDDLERREDITTGVIITPNPQYFPVSIERFIAEVLEDEFNV